MNPDELWIITKDNLVTNILRLDEYTYVGRSSYYYPDNKFTNYYMNREEAMEAVKVKENLSMLYNNFSNDDKKKLLKSIINSLDDYNIDKCFCDLCEYISLNTLIEKFNES